MLGAWALVFGCERSTPEPGPVQQVAESAATSGLARSSSDAPPRRQRVRGEDAPESLSFVTRTVGGRDDEALPWVVALHGFGDRPEAFVHFLDGTPLRVRVIAPRALYVHEPGFDWFRTPVNGDEEHLARAVEFAVGELVPWIEQRSTDPRNVGKPVLLGFSQGGVLTFALALRHPDLFRAAIALGGRLPEQLWPTQAPGVAVPLLALHGSADLVVPIGPTRELVRHLAGLDHEVVFEEFPGVAHKVPAAMRQRLVAFVGEALGR